jgi:hypothetical protein
MLDDGRELAARLRRAIRRVTVTRKGSIPKEETRAGNDVKHVIAS